MRDQRNTTEAIILSLHSDTRELEQLAASLDYRICKIFIQKRTTPDTQSYVGKGKLEEIIDFLDTSEDNITVVLVNGELKPSQWFYLEKTLDITVYDRLRLILAIFEQRADRREARLQVKLAQLEYEKPFVRELIHRARSGEHPGFMGGGEYQVDDYYEMIKKQTKKIREDLEKIRQERALRRQHRHAGGFYLVSLAGYTNAGKSSLLNSLADEHVTVEGRLFSTLSTTTRRLQDYPVPILLSDTVGFIDQLPAWVIDAFHSTLEEIEEADVVLLVVDASESLELISKKLTLSRDTLMELGVTSAIIVVFNKIDICDESHLRDLKLFLKEDRLMDKERPIVFVSAEQKMNLVLLLDAIYDTLPRFHALTLNVPMVEQTQSFLSWLYSIAHVEEITYGKTAVVHLHCSQRMREKIIAKCLNLGGKVME
jgi:GTP-binding protein HflX